MTLHDLKKKHAHDARDAMRMMRMIHARGTSLDGIYWKGFEISKSSNEFLFYFNLIYFLTVIWIISIQMNVLICFLQ